MWSSDPHKRSADSSRSYDRNQSDESIPIRWNYLTSRHGRNAGRRRTADGRRKPAEEVPSSKGKVDPEIGYGESRGKGTETTQTGLEG